MVDLLFSVFYDHAILLITLDIADHPHMTDIGDRDPISVLCTTDCVLTREYRVIIDQRLQLQKQFLLLTLGLAAVHHKWQ